MRDDIHKSAPVSRVWKLFMKHCGRAADRGQRAQESAHNAALSDCKQELSPALVTRLRQAATDRQGKLFAEPLAHACAESVTREGGSVMEREILSHLARLEACGQSGEQAVLSAIRDAVSGRAEAQFRSMAGHWIKCAGAQEAAPAVQAAKDAVAAIDTLTLARELLEGGHTPRERKPSLNIDADLRN